jgi:hypothetical protein
MCWRILVSLLSLAVICFGEVPAGALWITLLKKVFPRNMIRPKS